jgi:L-lactate dehydrogenase complex protein LldF
MAWTLSSPGPFTKAGKAGRWVMHNIPFVVNNKMNPWFKQRDMPEGPKESFSEWYEKNEKEKTKNENETSSFS